MKKKSMKRTKRLGDEAFIDALFLRQSEGHSDTPHLDEGDGHFDFGGHSDLHLDFPHGDEEFRRRDAAIAISVEAHEAINEWVRLVNGRLMTLEKRVDSLEKRNK